MSNEITSSHLAIKTTGANLKRDKHAIHIQHGCKRRSCLICYMGQPYQMYVNMFRKGKNV